MATKLFVCKGAICKCSLQTAPGILDVTSQSIKKLEGKLQVTEGDMTFSTPFGNCLRDPKNPPPCVPNLSKWNTIAKATKIDGKLVLLEISTNTCSFGGQIEITNPNQTIGKTADLPTNEIVNPFKGEVHFRRKLEIGGNFALFPDGLNDVAEEQIYGFDWIRDVLDGKENYLELDGALEKQIVDYIGETAVAPVGNFQNTAIIRKSKYIHYIDFDFPIRKLKSEKLLLLTNVKFTITGTYSGSKSNDDFFDELVNAINGITSSVIITNQLSDSSGEIIEYNTNRAKINTYASTSSQYTTILTKIGGSYAAAQSSLLLTSFQELAKEHVPVKQYIDTPDGTERTGKNAGSLTLNLNTKNYYTPWLAAFKSDTTKIQALIFPDVLPLAGEIRFETSNNKIKIKPAKIAITKFVTHSYPTTIQSSDAVPTSNKVELEITFTDAIATNETVEARFYDDTKKSDANYKGDIIGVLNVLKNKIEYELTFRYVKVFFTDDNGWLTTNTTNSDNQLPTGSRLPASMTIRVGNGTHTKTNQLTRGQNSIDLFKPTGSQDPYLKNIFKQALIHYNPPIIISDSDSVAIDISEIFTRNEVRSGVVFINDDIVLPGSLRNKFIGEIQQLAKTKINASNGNLDGVTLALIPYTIGGLFGVSDGIGGTAKNAFATYLKFKNIIQDRATAAHEALHSLDLYHSFVDSGKLNTYIIPKKDALTKFVKEKTENVMDYTPAARSLYKWQWEKVQNDLPDVKIKP
ncbi:MAG: DUF4280 domain-containing protein [Flavobacteriaceae bacterium]|nr:DUF4280 domain-containing protein [Flavobacteriaceae bacterium]